MGNNYYTAEIFNGHCQPGDKHMLRKGKGKNEKKFRCYTVAHSTDTRVVYNEVNTDDITSSHRVGKPLRKPFCEMTDYWLKLSRYEVKEQKIFRCCDVVLCILCVLCVCLFGLYTQTNSLSGIMN